MLADNLKQINKQIKTIFSAASTTTTSSTTTTLAVSLAYEHDHSEYNDVGSNETDGEFSESDDNLYEETFTSGSLDKSFSAEKQEYVGQEGSLHSEIKKDFVPNETESQDSEEKAQAVGEPSEESDEFYEEYYVEDNASYEVDDEEFYDDEKDNVESQGDLYNDAAGDNQMTRSESEVNFEVEEQLDDKEHPEANKDTEADANKSLAKAKEKTTLSPSQAPGRRFSDLNSLTVSAVENAQYNNLKERDSKGDIQGGEGPEEKYQPPEEKSWTESSMGEGVHPDNLDPVSLEEDVQRRKELETENQEEAVDADQGKLIAEEAQTFGEIPKEKTMKFREVQKQKAEKFGEIPMEEAKKLAEPDQDLFLGNYQQVRMK